MWGSGSAGVSGGDDTGGEPWWLVVLNEVWQWQEMCRLWS